MRDMLYFIEAKVTRTHAGISAPFQDIICKLVNADCSSSAKTKYEKWCYSYYAPTMPSKIDFEYLKFVDEIK